MTPGQQDKLLKALDQYLSDSRAEAEKIVKEQYLVGKYTVSDKIASGIRGFLTDPDMVSANSLVRGNIDLITQLSGKYLNEVESMTRQAMESGMSPNDLATMFNKANLTFASSARLVAYDQVAKAQELGRTAEYAALGVERVEVSVAPDACEICQGYDGMIVSISDTENRPQFHLQCLCFDFPDPDDVQRIQGEDTPPGGEWFGTNLENDMEKAVGEQVFTKEQEDVLNSYTSHGLNYVVNGALRDETELTSEVTNSISQIDDIIAANKGLEHDSILYRCLDESETGSLDKYGKMIGTTIYDPAYMSTSTSSDASLFFGPTQFEIHAPAGTPGLWLEGATVNFEENEFLIAHGMELKIMDVQLITIPGEMNQLGEPMQVTKIFCQLIPRGVK